MKCAIMQPTFLPWMGYFDLIDQVDVFVLLDNVQLSRQSWQTRNRIKTAQGESYLSVPTQRTGSHRDLLISEARVASERKWKKKHLATIQQSYSKAPFYKDGIPDIARLYGQDFRRLAELNEAFIRLISTKLGINSRIVRASDLNCETGMKGERLVHICRAVECSRYLSPPGAAAYLEHDRPGGELRAAGIELLYHQYQHPTYVQLHGDFLSHMSIVDVVLNVGFDETVAVIRSGRHPGLTSEQMRVAISQTDSVKGHSRC